MWPSQVIRLSSDNNSSPYLQLGLEFSEPADCEHLHGERDPSADEFAGGPGNGTASGERPPILCFALVHYLI